MTADQACNEDLPRVECSCGWTWTALDALEKEETTAERVRSRLASMAEGHAYFHRDGTHDVEIIGRDDVDEGLVAQLQETTA